MLSAVVTGYEVACSGVGFSPTFDVFCNERKCGELTGGYGYATPQAALDAGARAVEFLKEHEVFPNLCAEF